MFAFAYLVKAKKENIKEPIFKIFILTPVVVFLVVAIWSLMSVIFNIKA